MLWACGQPPALEGPGPDPDTELTDLPYVNGFQQGGFCEVQSVFQVGCVVGCHSGLVPEGDLDLETDPYSALVGVYSQGGKLLVDPGQPGNSFLLAKMEGDLAPSDGAIMPPEGAYGELMAPVIEKWIKDGAPAECGDPVVETYPEDERYHPDDWTQPDRHGLAANLQTDGDCRGCHGDQLDGGNAGVSCDTCHDPGWRDNCTFCHGGTDNQTGAPPQDIDNNTVGISFPAHSEHVYGDDHVQYGCSECHEPRGDVLDPGHIFQDLTAGYGEVSYGNGLSLYATYLFGSCSNVYCHGTGQGDDGSVTVGDTMYCYSCHADITVAAQWQYMSGEHETHLQEGVTCSECHGQTTDAAQNIVGPTYHVNGIVEMVPVGVQYDGTTCQGACHGHNHGNDTWE
jgi:predicted CxxxxCH...CXXCH cytochrome family protein